MKSTVRAVRWNGQVLELLDQRLLPVEERWLACDGIDSVAFAIKEMVVRGAPVIGIAAAYGMALRAAQVSGPAAVFVSEMEAASKTLAATRPTAVNLFWALERVMRRAAAASNLNPQERALAVAEEAIAIDEEDLQLCLAMGRHGAALLPDRGGVMTHCNAGALATGGHGTALGVIRSALWGGKQFKVYSRETRPLLQGARLTAWELLKDGIDVTLLCDSAAAHAMSRGLINAVIVGADRIAANGDTANKIGTQGLAILARHFGIPFYVAAPYSTVDLLTRSGESIVIEERSPQEVRFFQGVQSAPEQVPVLNPAFDVTPAELITAIITDRGVVRAPYPEQLLKTVGRR
jgi:methylthioribose-1-phosphate isomerase